jgi:hypothetical protein
VHLHHRTPNIVAMLNGGTRQESSKYNIIGTRHSLIVSLQKTGKYKYEIGH